MSNKTLLDFLPEIFEEVRTQLASDQLRWGNTWKHRPREGQEERAFNRFADYWDQYEHGRVPIPWLKIIGESIICLVREKHPEEKEEY